MNIYISICLYIYTIQAGGRKGGLLAKLQLVAAGCTKSSNLSHDAAIRPFVAPLVYLSQGTTGGRIAAVWTPKQGFGLDTGFSVLRTEYRIEKRIHQIKRDV